MMQVDFGKTAGDYRRHRAGFPEAYFARVAQYGIGVKTQSLLDLGTGTGTLARGFAHRGCRVTGLDPSAAMMAQARHADTEEGVQVDYIEARAEASGLPDSCFDVITAGQCWHWFERDAAAREAKRMLRPQGALVISHLDWLPATGNVAAASEAMIRRHNPQWNLGGGKGIYPQWFSDLMEAGFVGIESFSFDVDIPYSHEAWRGRLRASAGIAASLEQPAIERFDAELAAMLAADFPEPVLAIAHRVFTVLGRKPQA